MGLVVFSSGHGKRRAASTPISFIDGMTDLDEAHRQMEAVAAPTKPKPISPPHRRRRATRLSRQLRARSPPVATHLQLILDTLPWLQSNPQHRLPFCILVETEPHDPRRLIMEKSSIAFATPPLLPPGATDVFDRSGRPVPSPGKTVDSSSLIEANSDVEMNSSVRTLLRL
ncbi:hypothetical protein ACLOJK_002040 [Asimina triloba]